jgi:hypothetical protein
MRMYEEIQSAMPSLVIAAKRPDGADATGVRLLVDRLLVAERLPPTAVDLDPGEHVIRLEHAGWMPAEQMVVLREGEKNRRLTLRFEHLPPSTPGDHARIRTPNVLGMVMLGVAVVAAGVGVTFGVIGKVGENDLASSACGQNGTCSRDAVDAIRRDYWTAGIVGGIGAVSLGIGLWQINTQPAMTAGHVVFGPSGVRAAF